MRFIFLMLFSVQRLGSSKFLRGPLKSSLPCNTLVTSPSFLELSEHGESVFLVQPTQVAPATSYLQQIPSFSWDSMQQSARMSNANRATPKVLDTGYGTMNDFPYGFTSGRLNKLPWHLYKGLDLMSLLKDYSGRGTSGKPDTYRNWNSISPEKGSKSPAVGDEMNDYQKAMLYSSINQLGAATVPINVISPPQQQVIIGPTLGSAQYYGGLPSSTY